MQCTRTVLELLDEIFLITALIGLEDDLGGRHCAVIGNVEEVADFIKENEVTALDANIFFARR